MADTFKARFKAAVIRFFEPQLQAIITDRILKFRAKLIEHGMALDRPDDSSAVY
jgi:hypothetical protein